jgi:glycosyltransferase involved in cell wall biosynthesis
VGVVEAQISVIIPVYNGGEFVKRAVESALGQQETAEVLLIEDGSEDDSKSVCRDLELRFSPRVRLLQHPMGRNMGAGASRNLGIARARYGYLAFLDADDYYLPNRFSRAAWLLADEGVDGVYECVGLELLDDHARATRHGLEKKKLTMKEFVSPDELFFKMRPIGESGYFSLDGLVVKKGLVEKAGLFRTDMPLSQDTEWLVRLAISGSLVPGEIGEPVAMAGLHQGNRSQHVEKLAANRPVMFGHLVAWAFDQGIDERYLARLVERLYVFIWEGAKRGPPVRRRLSVFGSLIQTWWKIPRLLARRETGIALRRLFG